MTDTLSLRSWIFDRFLPQNLRGRDKKTHRQYRFAVNDFERFLGREPLLPDLTDEQYATFLTWLLDVRQLAEITANERAGRIKTFWNWAARKRYVDQFPTVGRVTVPERLPHAWRLDELRQLFDACKAVPGMIGDVPAGHWWFTLHAWLWNTAERISATLDMPVASLDLRHGVATVPASIRKGKRKSAVYRLLPDVVDLLREMLPPNTPPRRLVFDYDRDRTVFYREYRDILAKAGLPVGRECMPHCMRVSRATWGHIDGEDATAVLGHRSEATTRKSYLDPRLIAEQDTRQTIRPWADDPRRPE